MGTFMKKEDGFAFNIDVGNEAIATHASDNLEIHGFPVKERVAEVLISALEAKVVRELPVSLTVERVAEALESLLYIRVLQCRHERVKGFEDLHHSRITYPAAMWPVVRAIGDVEDQDEAIYLKVVAGGNLTRFSEKGYDWSLISETLQALRNYGESNGLELAFALPKGKDGDLGIMTFMVTESGRLMSHSKHKTAVDTMIRAAIDFQFADYLWGTPRWEYNSLSFYHGQLAHAVRDTIRD